jgi:hypothetical protein
MEGLDLAVVGDGYLSELFFVPREHSPASSNHPVRAQERALSIYNSIVAFHTLIPLYTYNSPFLMSEYL